MSQNVAILLAGGVGKRFGAELPKQLLTVAGQTVLEHSIDAFQQCPAIDEIALVVHPSCLVPTQDILERKPRSKVKKLLLGGAERYDSTLAALEAYTDDVNLLFHDAVRPAVSRRIIEDVCRALSTAKAVNVVVPMVDTMIEISPDGRTIAVPDRTRLRRVQTPQGFRRATLAEAYRRARLDPDFRGTDDCGVVFRYLPEVDIALVEGDERNLKLTYSDDLARLEQLLSTSL